MLVRGEDARVLVLREVLLQAGVVRPRPELLEDDRTVRLVGFEHVAVDASLRPRSLVHARVDLLDAIGGGPLAHRRGHVLLDVVVDVARGGIREDDAEFGDDAVEIGGLCLGQGREGLVAAHGPSRALAPVMKSTRRTSQRVWRTFRRVCW